MALRDLLPWRKPVPAAVPGSWERALREIALYNSPFMAIGEGTQADHTRLMRSVTGAAAIATRAISERVSGLEWQVLSQRVVRRGTIEEEVLDDHPLKLLLDNPSPWHTARQFKRIIAHHLVTVGESYIVKIGNRLGIPERLQMLPPDRIQPVGDGAMIEGYEFISIRGEERRRLTPEEVCRIWQPDPDSMFHARGVLGPQGRLADMLEFSEEHLRSFYESDASPQVVLEAADQSAQAPDPSVMERFAQAWSRRQNRRRGTHRGVPPFVAPGWQAHVLDAASTLASTKDVMAYARDSILMAYGVPRSVVGDVVDANRAAAETNAYVFDKHTITPIADAICDALTLSLARDFPQQQGVRIVVRFAPFVSEDKDYELRTEDQDLRLKVRTINHVREDRGLDPVEWGEIPIGTFADTPYTGEEPEPAMPPDDPAAFEDAPDEEEGVEEERHRSADHPTPLALEAWGRAVEREKTYTPQFEARMKRTFDKQEADVLRRLRSYRERVAVEDIFNPRTWYRFFELHVEPIRRSAFQASGKQALAMLGVSKDFVFSERVLMFLKSQGAALVQHVNETTRKNIRKELVAGQQSNESVDQIASRIRGVFDVRRKRARTIARTEILKSTQEAQVEGFDQSGVVAGKQWNTSLDAAVRDEHHIDGQRVSLRGSFVLGDGEMADAPGVGLRGGHLSAHNAINCRCFVTPVTISEAESA